MSRIFFWGACVLVAICFVFFGLVVLCFFCYLLWGIFTWLLLCFFECLCFGVGFCVFWFVRDENNESSFCFRGIESSVCWVRAYVFIGRTSEWRVLFCTLRIFLCQFCTLG